MIRPKLERLIVGSSEEGVNCKSRSTFVDGVIPWKVISIKALAGLCGVS